MGFQEYRVKAQIEVLGVLIDVEIPYLDFKPDLYDVQDLVREELDASLHINSYEIIEEKNNVF